MDYWDLLLALAALIMLAFLRWPAWLVVLICAGFGAVAL
jgi:hypothetical protein